MKTRQDVIEHAASATGVDRAEVRRVLDAAFAFVRASALAGEDLTYPGLGKIKVRSRTDEEGVAKTIYRFDPSASPDEGASGDAGADAPRRQAGAGKRKGAGKGRAGGRGRGSGPARADEAG